MNYRRNLNAKQLAIKTFAYVAVQISLRIPTTGLGWPYVHFFFYFGDSLDLYTLLDIFCDPRYTQQKFNKNLILIDLLYNQALEVN